MLPINKPAQLIVAILIISLLIGTRGHQPILGSWLPVSTIGLFFLLGVYLPSFAVLTLALFSIWLMDITGITWEATDSFCLSQSYSFLLASYIIYWWGGRWFARHHQGILSTDLRNLSIAAFISASVGFAVISIGFHYFSGLFEPNFTQLAHEYTTQLPGHLLGLAFYLVIALLIHRLLAPRIFCQQHKPSH